MTLFNSRKTRAWFEKLQSCFTKLEMNEGIRGGVIPEAHNQSFFCIGKSKYKLVDTTCNEIPIIGSAQIRLVDDPKVRVQLSIHLREKRSAINDIVLMAPESMKWPETQAVIQHIIDEHYEEVKLEKPVKETTFLINDFIETDGYKNTATGEVKKFNITRCLQSGDTINVTTGYTEWEALI